MAAVTPALLGKLCFHVQLMLVDGKTPAEAKGGCFLLRVGLVLLEN